MAIIANNNIIVMFVVGILLSLLLLCLLSSLSVTSICRWRHGVRSLSLSFPLPHLTFKAYPHATCTASAR